MSKKQETCSSYTRYGGFLRSCKNPVKDEGLCARHLAGKRRSETNERKRQEQYELRSARLATAESQVDRLERALRKALDVDESDDGSIGSVGPYWFDGKTGPSTQSVIVSVKTLDRIINRLMTYRGLERRKA